MIRNPKKGFLWVGHNPFITECSLGRTPPHPPIISHHAEQLNNIFGPDICNQSYTSHIIRNVGYIHCIFPRWKYWLPIKGMTKMGNMEGEVEVM